MTDDRDPLLDELRTALSVQPTPEFAAGVRMRLERERVAPLWRRYVLMAAAAVVLAVMGAWGLRPAAPAPPSSAALVEANAIAPPAPVVEVTRKAPDARPGLVVTRERARPMRSGSEPAVRVSREEVEAFWRLLSHPRTETVTFVSARPRIDQETGEVAALPGIAAIQVPALQVDPLPGADDAPEMRGIDD